MKKEKTKQQKKEQLSAALKLLTNTYQELINRHDLHNNALSMVDATSELLSKGEKSYDDAVKALQKIQASMTEDEYSKIREEINFGLK